MKRNQPCPCNSGKKYKKCCGSLRVDQSANTGDNLSSSSSQETDEQYTSAKKYYDRGTVSQDKGNMDEAVVYYRKALSFKPEYIEALINLGLVLRIQKVFDEAEVCFQKALSLSPQSNFKLLALLNLGIVLEIVGKLDEAIECFENAISLNPSLAEGYGFLGGVYQLQGLTDTAAENFKKALKIKPDLPLVQTQLAIVHWIHGDYETCRQSYSTLKQKLDQFPHEEKIYLEGFGSYLGKLLTYRETHPGIFKGVKDLPTLYAIGDSHCLSLANTQVNFRGKAHKIKARLITGCKAWHLANSQANKYKSSIEQIASLIPEGTYVFVLFGEIDCRLNEGILNHHKKTGNELNKSIQTLVEEYIEQLDQTFKPRNLRAVVCNVPAPCLDTYQPTQAEKQLLSEIVHKFNIALETCAKRKDMLVLDIYSVSANDSGLAQAEKYIDKCHLKPDVVISRIANIL